MVMGIVIDINKAKAIAHDARRAARAAEFAPLDIKATIPSEAAAAEAARQAIRDKYAALQAQMDAAQTPEQLKALMP
jgi:Spy/CpxP family protein refolding chaperone